MMPDHISVSDFIKEAWDDHNSPTTSNFVSIMSQCKNTVFALEEIIDNDRSGLNKMKKSVKALTSSGLMNMSNEAYLADNLEKLGNTAMNRENEQEIGQAFLKFSVVTKELSMLMKNLMQNINNILMFPLDSFLKGDLKGVKGDLKKPFDKASKEYEAKFSKIEKEKKRLAGEAGMIKTDIAGAEVAEDLEKERRSFQLQTCEYLIKANEIKTKKGVVLLQHLVEYYHAQMNYFADGMKTIEHFRYYIEELVGELGKIKQRQDEEKRELVKLRDALKTSVSVYKESPSVTSGYSLHQLQGNKAHGCVKSGYLLKKSEGKMRKVWQRRRCTIQEGVLAISHSDLSKPPVKLNLLTCQVKLVTDDPGKKCFDLISSSKSRTYHFQAEDQQDMEQWISILNNAKEAVFMKEVGDSNDKEGYNPINQNVKELTRTILQEVRRLPGNSVCCDCGSPDPEWLSVNLGVLICLECCGVHRDLGVHISRTQSIVIDDLGTAQLLLARVVSNRGFNDIMEAMLVKPDLKPTPTSNMDLRKQFIKAKYERRKYALVTCTNEDRKQELKQAIMQKDIYTLLQVYAEGVDFTEPLPDMQNGETALHLAIEEDEDCSFLFMVDFIVQNSNSQFLFRPTSDGSTPLHLCAQLNATESMKLLLRNQPELVNYENKAGKTARDIAIELGHDTCVELINHAIAGKSELFNNVNIDWELINDDHCYEDLEFSDDDLDRCNTPDRKNRSRPGSLVLSSESTLPLPNSRERSLTADSLKFSSLQPPPPPSHPQKSKGGTLPRNQDINASTMSKKKAPAPPPPGAGHSRNPSLDALSSSPSSHSRRPSDPGLFSIGRGHMRSPSDPQPHTRAFTGPALSSNKTLPAVDEQKQYVWCRDNIVPSLGAKLVLPPGPPPKDVNLQSNDESMQHLTSRPKIASKPPHIEQQRSSVNGDKISSESISSCTTAASNSIPVPHPRIRKKTDRLPRCKALYDCEADNEDELSFAEGEIILLINKEEEEWWEGCIEGQQERRGMFPAPFVHVIPD